MVVAVGAATDVWRIYANLAKIVIVTPVTQKISTNCQIRVDDAFKTNLRHAFEADTSNHLLVTAVTRYVCVHSRGCRSSRPTRPFASEPVGIVCQPDKGVGRLMYAPLSIVPATSANVVVAALSA